MENNSGGQMTLKELINNHYKDLSQTDLHILNQVISKDFDFKDMTIKTLAQLCDSSMPTVHRTIKKIGFQGYSEFKYFMITQNKKNDDTPIIDYKAQILNNVQLTLESINEASIKEFIDVMDQSSTRYAYGTGWKQTSSMQSFSNDLISYSKPLILLRTPHDLESTTKQMKEGDVLFISSLSGNTKGISDILKYLNLKGVKVISFTAYGTNDISIASKINFYFKDDNLDNNIIPWPAYTLKILLEYLVYRYHEHHIKKNTL